MERILLFDRQDRPLGELPPNDVFALIRTERVNGEHSLKITTTKVLQKGWRILVCDSRQKWREFVVYGTDALHDSGEKPFGDYYCVWSLQPDLMGTRVSAMPGVQTPCTAAVALAAALGGTLRWSAGAVTNASTGGASMYDTDGWSALSILLANWGGEIDTTIEVGLDGVVARKVDLYALQGDQDAKRRYDFGADIKSIRRKIPDGPLYCRITPRGMGEETEEGYGRKITIAPVNDGKDYLENSDMVDLAKLPDGQGGWEYPTIEIENGDCKTPQELLDWSLPLVNDYTIPKITYEIDVLQLAQEGVDMHGVSLGDAIHAVDRKFGDGLRVSGRVLQTVVNLLDEADMQITVGNIAEDLASMIGSLETRLSAVTDTLTVIAGGMGAADYYSNLLAHLNAQINATGGYTYITEGEGIRCYDHSVTDPLVGAEATKAVEMKGGSIRIADTKTAQGVWEWKTVFVSGKIASEVLSASNITTGALRVEDANHNAVFIADMDAGTVQMAGDAITIGQRTLVDLTSTVYGTFSRDTVNGSVRYNAYCEAFEPSDDTVLKLKSVYQSDMFGFSTPISLYINGDQLPSNHGSHLYVPQGQIIKAGKINVIEVEHYDQSHPDYWRWKLTGNEDAETSENQASRAMFARDTSEIEINGGKVTFNAGTFVVNSTDFQVDEDGVITATAGSIGGCDISPLLIKNDAMELNGDGLYFLRNSQVVAAIDPVLSTSQIDASELNFLVPKLFNFLAKAPSSSGGNVRPMRYELNTSYGGGTGKMEFVCDVDFDLVPTITGAITGAVNIPKLNGSGYYCTLTFTNGILTDITYL